MYASVADRIEKEIVGIRPKDGIIVKGYKMHFIDRVIGQYESSNESMKGAKEGVSIENIKKALRVGQLDKTSDGNSIRYITNDCIVTLNPHSKELIQTTPKNREEDFMTLSSSDIEFIKKNISNANDILKSNDPNLLIDALDDFTVITMDENDDITDIGRQAERIIDKIVYSD